MIGHPFYILESVDSTNNYAMAQVNSGDVTSGTAWYTGNQTAGKGTRGKKWLAEPGDISALTVAIHPGSLPLSSQFMLSIVIALGAHDFLSKYAGDDTIIKWPNDIYWRDRKAGGTLIENVIRGTSWQYAIIGIGINLNQAKFPDELKNAVSLRQITGKTWEGPIMAKELCSFFDLRVNQLQTVDHHDLLKEYKSKLFRFGIPSPFRINGEIYTATIVDVQPTGHIVLERNGNLEEYGFGEIEFILG
ncbi:biotin--[acetyl-CoA-carboxylase] ligase [Chitinophaga sp. Cy-1792]|uniref:biotin--[acetyl-CoA-carboxylase] ligase n=1 Tax=Chitinophaga sp. Cy-1792 TaxID=2608339 RepID=UPI00141F71D9|nr:biotin--[acetyl-CoA-carboxylase] ligase [Chitinophaga sp. Cy-1792]